MEKGIKSMGRDNQTPESLDRIIRRRAAAKLNHELTILFKPILERLGSQPLELHRYVDQTGRRTSAKGAIEEVIAAIYRNELAAREQQAVEDYVTRLDKFQEMLNDLKAEASTDTTLFPLTGLTADANKQVVATARGLEPKPFPVNQGTSGFKVEPEA